MKGELSIGRRKLARAPNRFSHAVKSAKNVVFSNKINKLEKVIFLCEVESGFVPVDRFEPRPLLIRHLTRFGVLRLALVLQLTAVRFKPFSAACRSAGTGRFCSSS